MPRRNRPKREAAPPPRVHSATSPIPAPGGWQAMRHRGGDSVKDYVCPRCERVVARQSDHVVAWRLGEEDRRRHWHRECWATAVREGIDRYRWV